MLFLSVQRRVEQTPRGGWCADNAIACSDHLIICSSDTVLQLSKLTREALGLQGSTDKRFTLSLDSR